MRGRLFWKIWGGFWATFLVLGYGLWLFWSLAPTLNQGDWDGPRAVGRVLVASAANALKSGGPSALARQIAAWPQAERERLTVRTGPGACRPADDRAIAVSIGAGEEQRCLHYATPASPDDDGATFLAMPLDLVIGAALAGLAFSAALAWYLTRPIRQLRRAFSQLADGDFAVRLRPSVGRRRDEISDLAIDFDRMAERLAELVAARDRLLHDVSHELRSPLARMRVAVGLLRREPARSEAALARVDRETDNIDELVGELLTLARLESGAAHDVEYCDLLEMLNGVLDDVRFEAASHDVRIETSLPGDPSEQEWLVAGSGLLLRRATENILRNALRFSPASHAIRVTLVRMGEGCALTVEDDGPGIHVAEPSVLLKPFVREGAGEGEGYGLGLSIAKRAVVACGGTLDLANRTPTGLRVHLELPLVTADIRS